MKWFCLLSKGRLGDSDDGFFDEGWGFFDAGFVIRRT